MGPREVWTAGGSTDSTAVSRRNSTLLCAARKEASLGIASFELDADLVRAPQCANRALGKLGLPLGKSGVRQELAALTHLGAEKSFDHGERFRTACDDDRSPVDDFDPRRPGDFLPDVARAHCTPPMLAALLPGHGDESKIADRSAVRLRIAIDDHGPQAEPRRRQGMRQPENAAADNCQIVHQRLASKAAGLRRVCNEWAFL